MNAAMEFKYPDWTTVQLKLGADMLDEEIRVIQKSKDHFKHRKELATKQSALNSMRMEIKRREGVEKRVKWSNAS